MLAVFTTSFFWSLAMMLPRRSSRPSLASGSSSASMMAPSRLRVRPSM